MYSLAQWLAIEPGPKATPLLPCCMGIQDRDWYKDGQKHRENGDFNRYHTGRSERRRLIPVSRLHPFWQVVLFGAICLGIFVVLKLIAKLNS